MSQTELAGTELSKAFISLIENGHSGISLRTAEFLATRLKVSIVRLLGDQPSPVSTGIRDELTGALTLARQMEEYGRLRRLDIEAALERLGEWERTAHDVDKVAARAVRLPDKAAAS